jgi:uncharacterized ferredoxin-like protein
MPLPLSAQPGFRHDLDHHHPVQRNSNRAGLSGPEGMAIALLIGAVVCTALSVSGSFITDLKIGYWIGATPRNQERLNSPVFLSQP